MQDETTTKVVAIYHYPEPFLVALQNAISRAQSEILMEYYIFEDDKVGRKVSELLIQASNRGVKVKVMVDGIGSPYFSSTLMPHLESQGVECRVFNPLPFDFSFHAQKRFRYFFYRFIRGFFMINKRDHRKVALIDSNVAFVGSHNITSKILGPPPWRESSLTLVGSEIQKLKQAFYIGWEDKTPKTVFSPSLNSRVRLNDSWMVRRYLYRDLAKKILFAKNRIWITSAYFTPPWGILRCFRIAKSMGVDIRILVPSLSDVPMAKIITTAFYNQMVSMGVKVFEYSPSMLHAKTMIIDDWFLIGSSNLNHRSLFHDLELDVSVAESEHQMSLEKQFLSDLSQSKEITMEVLSKKSIWSVLWARFLVSFRYWF